MFSGRCILTFSTFILQFVLGFANRTCPLEKVCSIGSFHHLTNLWAVEYISTKDYPAFICQVKSNEKRFNFDRSHYDTYFKNCAQPSTEIYSVMELRFPKNRKKIMDSKFNFQGAIDFIIFNLGDPSGVYLYTSNIGGFDVDLAIKQDYLTSLFANQSTDEFFIQSALINSRLDFYTNGKLIKSCSDLINSNNGTHILTNSIFQLKKIEAGEHYLLILNCQQR